MRKIKEPAYKSYFFGPGYTDMITSVKNIWIKNNETAKKCHDIYKKKGINSLLGIYNLFYSISVVIFGTLFSAIVCALITLVLAVFFFMVYIIFFIVWSVDHFYLVSRKIFVACHVCKSNSLIPIYICPNCGAKHTKLTPGVYGIFSRRCLCGKKLPTAFFNGRKKLEAICPVCLEEGRITNLNDRESRPFCVPVVGGRSVGKTAYITAFSNKFIEEIAPSNNIKVEFYNSDKRDIYDEIRNDYISGETRMTARALDINETSSVSFSFFVQNDKLKPERLIHIYDIAGEVFTDNRENEIQRQYEYCQGIILMLDPFSIPGVRAKYESELTQEDISGIGATNIRGIIDGFYNKLRQIVKVSDTETLSTPLAVVIGKIDSGNLAEEFSQNKIDEVKAENIGKNIDDIDAVDYLCRKFLKDNNMGAIISLINNKFRNNRFFVCSAIGHTRSAGEYKPKGVTEPIEWIAEIEDPAFASLWCKNKIKKKAPLDE